VGGEGSSDLKKKRSRGEGGKNRLRDSEVKGNIEGGKEVGGGEGGSHREVRKGGDMVFTLYQKISQESCGRGGKKF